MANLNIIKVMETCLNHKNVGNKGPQSLTIDDVNKQFLDDAQNAAINKKEIRNIYVRGHSITM